VAGRAAGEEPVNVERLQRQRGRTTLPGDERRPSSATRWGQISVLITLAEIGKWGRNPPVGGSNCRSRSHGAGRSSQANSSPVPSGPWSTNPSNGWNPKPRLKVGAACSFCECAVTSVASKSMMNGRSASISWSGAKQHRGIHDCDTQSARQASACDTPWLVLWSAINAARLTASPPSPTRPRSA
jgi:hypothetical protein